MRRRLPAPTVSAKSASSFSKTGLLTPSDKYQTVSPACRLNEGGDVEPFVAMMAKRQRPLADRRPDPAAHRFQAEAMLVARPDLNGLVRMVPRFFGGDIRELFLKAGAPPGCRRRSPSAAAP